MGRAHRSGFTLIELLVVISIIALLISLLLPALSSARSSAQMTGSLSQVKQITIAIHAYATDHDDRLPFHNFSEGSPSHVGWGTKMLQWAYLPSKDIFWSAARTADPDDGMWHRHTGYGLNSYACTSAKNLPGGPPPVDLGEAAAPPHDKFLLAAEVWSGQWDVNDPGRDGLYFASASRRGSDDGPLGDGGAVNSKLFTYNGANVHSFIDGHAVAIDPKGIGYEANNDGYSGYWHYYTSVGQFRGRAPWYREWQIYYPAD